MGFSLGGFVSDIIGGGGGGGSKSSTSSSASQATTNTVNSGAGSQVNGSNNVITDDGAVHDALAANTAVASTAIGASMNTAGLAFQSANGQLSDSLEFAKQAGQGALDAVTGLAGLTAQTQSNDLGQLGQFAENIQTQGQVQTSKLITYITLGLIITAGVVAVAFSKKG